MPSKIQPAPSLTFTKSEGVGRATRTALQGGIGAFITTGLMLFNILELTADQAVWLGTALTTVVASLQNFLEQRRGHLLIGAAPQKAVRAKKSA